MQKQKRLLFVGNSFEYFVSHRLTLAQAAVKEGWSVHVACPASMTGATLAAHGIAHHCLLLDRKGINPFREIGSLLRIRDTYLRVKPDLVHLIGPKAVMYGGLLARLVSIPSMVCLIPGMGYLYQVAGWKGRIARALGHLGYRLGLLHRNKRVIFQNPEDRQLFIGLRLCKPQEAQLILGSGADPAQWPAVPEPAGIPVVVFASRFLREKGIEIFVGVARQLLSEGVAARFALVGDVDPGNPSSVSAAELQSWTDEGIENWGYRRDMARVFQDCHLVCLPTYRREGIPKVLIEAAASGRPIVTFDVPGCREIVQDGVSGIVVPLKDTDALKQAVHRLLRDGELRRRMGREGRKRVEEVFALDHVIRQTLQTYRQVCRDEERAEASR